MNAREVEVFETGTGLGVRIRANGGKSLVVQKIKHGVELRRTLGEWPQLTLANARRAVEVLIGEMAMGVDVIADWDSALRNKIERLGHLGQSATWVLRKVRKDGGVIWTRETGRAMLVKNRPVVLVASEDVTEAKRAAEALREMEMQLAHSNRLETMGQLTASIAHEVNHPIATAVTNARVALRFLHRDPPDLNEVGEALDCIVRDGGRAAAVVQRIRDLSKKASSRDGHVEINAAAREVIEFTRSEATKSGVSVRSELAEGLPLVRGDRVELQQVMLNLILNAVEAMSGMDGGEQELLITTGKNESGDILVSVRDSGSGLPPEVQKNLFKAFQTTKPNGLGLGLSICRSIVERHGGRLWATAKVPRGTVFQFTLPSNVDDEPPERSGREEADANCEG